MRRRVLVRVGAVAALVAALMLSGVWGPAGRVTVQARTDGLLMPIAVQQFLDDTGRPLSGGKLYAYAAGTTTPQSTYSNSALTTANTNPVVLNSAGRATVYLTRGLGYKFVLKTSAGVTVWTQDNVSVPSEVVPPSPDAVPTGTILAFGGTSAPTGYLLCQGQAIDRTVYAALYTVLGTAYGAGDGKTTFNVPNLQQRFPLGLATSGTGSTLGGTGGTIDATVNLTHTHGVPRDGWTGELKVSGTSGRLLVGDNGVNVYQPTGDNTTGASTRATSTAINPPFQAVNYIVKTDA